MAGEALILSAAFSKSLFSPARRFDDAVNPARRKGRGALAPGFLADGSQDLGLGSGKPDIVPDAQQDRSGSSPLLDHQRPAFLIDSVQQLAEARPGSQGGNHPAVLCSGFGCWHETLQFISLNCTVTNFICQWREEAGVCRKLRPSGFQKRLRVNSWLAQDRPERALCQIAGVMRNGDLSSRLRMARDAGDLVQRRVEPNTMGSALAIQNATMVAQMAFQLREFHASAISKTSRTACGERPFSASSRWHCSASFSASARFALASSMVSPCEIAAGISSTKQV